MPRAILAACFAVLGVVYSADVHAQPQNLFVQSEQADEMNLPSSNSQRMNRIYARTHVTVYEIQNGWGRVNPSTAVTPRWVEMRNLGPIQPAELPAISSPLIFSDPRIGRNAIRIRPGDGLSENDILMLWRAARQALNDGCTRIQDGDKSVSLPETYYIKCEGDRRNRFYTASQLMR